MYRHLQGQCHREQGAGGGGVGGPQDGGYYFLPGNSFRFSKDGCCTGADWGREGWSSSLSMGMGR